MTIKTRFCPSPTGIMHLGNARTALFSALFAQARDGVFLLRIEDTDRERSRTEYAEQLCHDLEAMGLYWQEGPMVGGDQPSYYQSERQSIYDHYYTLLEEKGSAYPCFCSEEELAWQRKAQLSSGQPPRYPGTCRHLTAEQVEDKLAQGLEPTLRFRIPDDEMICFTDVVRGEQRFATNDIGDFIIRRTNGTSPFMFCNAIDDSLMGVTHVLRGEDHLTNTPRQLLILKALSLPTPHYGHLPLILGGDGTPLSKRNGSRSIKELLENGYFPSAICNYMARLGHYYESHELLDFSDLAANFKLENIGRAPARFDSQQLWHWQKLAVQQADTEILNKWLSQEAETLIPAEKRENFLTWVKPNIVLPEELNQWAVVCFSMDLSYGADAKAILKQTDSEFFKYAEAHILQQGSDYHGLIAALKEQLNINGKKLFQPLRAALTGEIAGPELAPILSLMPVTLIVERFKRAVNYIQTSHDT